MKVCAKFLVVLALLSLSSGCKSGGSGGLEEVPPPDEVTSGKVGPFAVTVPVDGSYYDHEFHIKIAQNEGKVEYLITQPVNTYIDLMESKAAVNGCDSKQVKVDTWFFQNADDTLGSIVAPASRMRALEGKKAKLAVLFRDLSGCTELHYKVKLKRHISIAEQTPEAVYGSWYASEYDPNRTNYQMSASFVKWTDDDIRFHYSNSCDDTESLSGKLVAIDSTAIPARMRIKITDVASVAGSYCSKQLGFSSGAVGYYLMCIYERADNYGPFQLACKLSYGSESDYPTSFAAVSTSWRQE